MRITVFQICSISLQLSNTDDPVFLFMDRKWAEGKRSYVYMVAGAAKLLRIYYARVNEVLSRAPQQIIPLRNFLHDREVYFVRSFSNLIVEEAAADYSAAALIAFLRNHRCLSRAATFLASLTGTCSRRSLSLKCPAVAAD